MRPFSAAWWRKEQRRPRQWWLWPYSMMLGIYFAGGFAWCVYKEFWSGAAFTGLVLAAHVHLFVRPSRASWVEHRVAKRADR
jgi:hypothetical protein